MDNDEFYIDIKLSTLLNGFKKRSANVFEYMKTLYKTRTETKQHDETNLKQRTEELMALVVNKLQVFSETIEELKQVKHLGTCS